MTPPLETVVVETAMGWAGVALSARGIRLATLFHRTEEACHADLRASGAITLGTSAFAVGDVSDALQAYVAGDATALERFPVDLPPCSPLQRDTWLALRDIPAGETRSYGWLARHVDRPGQARPVGAAVGANPIPLWLPCHRVVAANGNLHGFGGGLEMKRRLLELEGALPRPLASAVGRDERT